MLSRNLHTPTPPAAPDDALAARTSSSPSAYTATSHVPEPGQAPGMKVRVIAGGDGGPRTFAIVFAKGDEVMSGLSDWAKNEKVSSAQLHGIGAFSSALLAWFDKDRKAYKNIPVDEMVECVSFIGDVGLVEGKPALHCHASVGFADGAVKGGHVLKAHVFPTLELFAVEGVVPLHKHQDAETTLELFDLAGS